MAWQKQLQKPPKIKTASQVYEPKPIDSEISGQVLYDRFMIDWEGCRERHPGQKQVLNAVFNDKFQYIFYRAGRKGAKTTTAIDIAWRMAHMIPKSVGYLCYPTIAQGIEVVWEERRLQTCDRKDDMMWQKYVEKTDDTRHIVWFTNGSFIKLIGTWSEARGKGTQPDYLIFDEFQDCCPDYIEAMNPNLAAKNAPCIIMGTPPKKRNHYEEWWDRVQSNPRGKVFKFTSYDNIALPHLKDWLDNEKAVLLKANKEDVWLREYMAELCYSSSDRLLPDPQFMEADEIDVLSRQFAYADRVPVLAVSVHPSYFCAILAVLLPRRRMFVMDHVMIHQVWNRAFSEMYPLLGTKVKTLQDFCAKKIRQIVWDESRSFVDVVSGFTKCREDIKWQDRGFPLLRELIVKEKIHFSREIADFGLECQNLLIDEPSKDVHKNYPHICTISMMVNEYFSQEKMTIAQTHPFDKYDALREMGIPCQPKRKLRGMFTFSTFGS